jgi:hypothetical protein
VLENLNYVVYEEAGSSDEIFQVRERHRPLQPPSL